MSITRKPPKLPDPVIVYITVRCPHGHETYYLPDQVDLEIEGECHAGFEGQAYIRFTCFDCSGISRFRARISS